jgi:hypothetical protein
MGKPNFRNVPFYLILLVGTLLSMASIAALPRLREHDTQNTDVSSDTLAQKLGQLQASRAELDRPYASLAPYSYSMDKGLLWPSDQCVEATSGTIRSAAAVVAAAASPDAGIDAVGTPEEPENKSTLVDVWEFATEFQRVWPDRLDGSQQLRDAVMSRQGRSLSASVDGYRVKNVDRRGSREEREHFLLVQAWYDRQVQSSEAQVRSCGLALQGLLPDLFSWNDLARRTRIIACDRAAPPKDLSEAHKELRDRSSWVREKLRKEVLPSCAFPEWQPAPEPPKLGESLGPLRFLAAWLLNADSIPLTVIVGMIGFGLLGSAISTFVRERDPANANKPLVEDWMGAVIRGFSAAVVVYLSVQGGLGILSGADAEINPYVTLFVCFISAVFSELVWHKVGDYLKERLKGSSGGSTP